MIRSATNGCTVFRERAEAAPSFGEQVDGFPWAIFISDKAHVNFAPEYAVVDPPREVYSAVWVYSPTERAATLGLGPDDGARACQW